MWTPIVPDSARIMICPPPPNHSVHLHVVSSQLTSAIRTKERQFTGREMRRRDESASVDGLHEHRLLVGPTIAPVQVQYMIYEPV
jgi:hypothetical protein